MVAVSNELSVDSEPDDYLIELIGLKEDFPDDALVAYGKVYTRYWDVMYTISKSVTNDADVAMDLLADTFAMIYNKAASFNKGKIRDKIKIKLCIRKWMTTIMQRIFYDHYLPEEYKKGTNTILEDSLIIENIQASKHLQYDYENFIEQIEKLDQNSCDIDPSNLETESENLQKVREYLKKLPEREKDIILTTYNFYIPGKYTPTQVLNDLERKWETTRENIRKILEKFRKSIKEELQPKMYIRK